MRHAVSHDNLRGVYSGISDPSLAPIGKIEAKKAAKKIKKLSIDLIVSSPYKRTKQTAHIIAKEINLPKERIIFHDLVAERNLGIMEGKPYIPNYMHDGIEGVESEASVTKRAEEFLKWVNNQSHENILIVSHGSTSRGLRTILDPSVPFIKHRGLKNAEIIRLL
jgi:broad specificity phosphatase PhoE